MMIVNGVGHEPPHPSGDPVLCGVYSLTYISLILAQGNPISSLLFFA